MAKLTGMCHVHINGTRLRSEKGAELSPGGKIKKAATDTVGYVGSYTDEIKPGVVKLSVIHADDTDITALQNIEDATVVFETDSGQSYLVRQAATTGEVKIKDGKVDLELSGAAAELI